MPMAYPMRLELLLMLERSAAITTYEVEALQRYTIDLKDPSLLTLQTITGNRFFLPCRKCHLHPCCALTVRASSTRTAS